MAQKNSIKEILEKTQEKIAEYQIAEAKAKKEKAEVELETAKMQQAAIAEVIEEERRKRYKESRSLS